MAKGTSRLIKIPVHDGDGNNFDLTNGKAVFWVGKSVCSTGTDVIIEKSSAASGGITITQDGTLFTVEIVLDPADTEDEPSRASYFCECRVWDQSNNEYVVAAGAFEIDPSLTLPAPEPS